ncbi:helix-turn-helix domain-containing protein [Paenibacillus alkaliterrae]|uniref:helix-turn-helix domain-containing protein n=1 Tax=Paenibacillus alkaliterrae TaxID=320909 RepID=UPI001F44CD70|nr:helix-turn-helix domain-containing protein [Paenibacillus alkaliterrae]MCF2939008.1 helix-turn-helix domain-containing protein [Paenibacillus alkaliterrae]
MTQIKLLTLEQLPSILTAQNIADYLVIGRKRVYEYMQLSPAHGGIPCFSLGKTKRVEKKDFEKWIADRKNNK